MNPSPWKVAAVVFCIASAISLFTGAWYTEYRKDQRQQTAAADALALSDQIEAMTVQAGLAARAFSSRAMGLLLFGAGTEQLRVNLPSLPHLRHALVLDRNGVVVFDSRETAPTLGLDLSDRDYTSIHLSGRGFETGYIGAPVFGRIDGAWSIPVSVPVTTRDGRPLGIAILWVGEAYFATITAMANAEGKTAFLLHNELDRVIPLNVTDRVSVARASADMQRLLGRTDWVETDDRRDAGGLFFHEGANGEAFRRSPIGRPFDVVLYTPRAIVRELVVQDFSIFLSVAITFSAFLSFASGVYTTGRNLQARLWAAIERLPEAFVLYDEDDRVALFNDRYRQLYSHSASAIRIGETFENILRTGLRNGQYEEAVGREEAWLAERLAHHRNPSGPIDQALSGDKHLRIQEVRLPNGDTVGFRTDVTELKRQKRELAEKALALEVAATTDPLTQLNNRRGLEEFVQGTNALRDGAERVAVLHIDLDRFKPINDVFGHDAGDFLLKHVATILRRAVRASDAVARVGGDEFVVVLDAPTDEAAAERVAHRVISACARVVTWDGKNLHFGASVGIALGEAQQFSQLLTDADIALFEAKRAGRGRLHMFDAALRERVHRRKSLSDDLLRALETDEIVAFYQPQVDARDGRFIGYEALVRWQHPRLGILNPGAFLGVAEDLGVMPDIDERVASQAVATGLELVSMGHEIDGVSVNASLGRLTQPGEFSWLPDARSLPFGFCIEILEAIDVDRDFDEIAWVLDNYRQGGCHIEIDDFGSGRASLTSLLKIRPDRIKLDIEIVRAASMDATGAGSMVRAIAEMCKGLGVPMTAEGIESQAHADLMRELGCDKLQGFHFAMPMSKADLITWVEQRSAGQRPAWPRRA
jgi:diguanylate cyclase (GGDEF)-like protein